MSTQAQLIANRSNSQLSTGPQTVEGKARVSHNAVKTALTGATVLLPTDDVALYQQHVAATRAAWQPATHREKFLVQSIADTEWRLQRIPALISGILALARLREAGLFDDQPEDLRPILLEAHIQETKARELRNFSLQEARLRRHRQNDIAELEQLQKARRERRAEQMHTAVAMYLDYRNDKKPFHPAEFGFEFSIDEIEHRAAVCQSRSLCQYPEQYARVKVKELRAERLKLERKAA